MATGKKIRNWTLAIVGAGVLGWWGISKIVDAQDKSERKRKADQEQFDAWKKTNESENRLRDSLGMPHAPEMTTDTGKASQPGKIKFN